MPRADLLALSPDDLVALTNRGTVKRAQRELEANEVTGEFQEADDGTVTAKWSDGMMCLLPGGRVLTESRCSCPATELCRHIVRTVLAYQKQASATQPADAPSSWNPGDIADETIAKALKPAILAQAKSQFENGLLIEVMKGEKPTARFHDLACTLRFQVPGDVRYVHCDCAVDPPCVHVPLAVWAFRRLPAGHDSAIVTTQAKPLAAPTEALDAIEDALLDGVERGLAGAGTAWRDRLSRLEARCRDAGLVWPAEVILDLIHEFERYAESDSAFNPERFAELVGELAIRADAIRNDTGVVPQLLIRGNASDRWTDLAGSRFIGLGCGVRPGRRTATLVAYLQDANSGSLVAVRREFPDPPADSTDSPKDFVRLGATAALKGATFAQVGAGQLLTQGGKRATNHELVLGRAKAVVNPQNYSWEQLRSPVLAESFAEVRERLRMLPPSALRPRRIGEDFHVCAVNGAEGATFDAPSQTIRAVLRDARGDLATLRHPFTSRGSTGSERLLAALMSAGDRVRFVAGATRNTAEGLCIEPVAIVSENGSARTAIQPWIDAKPDTAAGPALAAGEIRAFDPIEEQLKELKAALSEVLTVGLIRADAAILRTWRQLEERADGLGLAETARIIGVVVQALAQKSATVRFDSRPVAATLLQLAVLLRMSPDIES